MSDTSGLVTTKIGEAENEIPDTRNLMTATVFNTKVGEVENDISDNYKYISTQEFKKLTEERFAGKLKQANLVN